MHLIIDTRDCISYEKKRLERQELLFWAYPIILLKGAIGIWQNNKERLEGYEIHMGVTERGSGVSPAIQVLSQNGKPADSFDGAITPDGRIWGSYFHGLFDMSGFRQAFLKSICPDYQPDTSDDKVGCLSEFKDRQYDLLAEHFRKRLDMDKLFKIVGFARKDGRLRIDS